MAKLQGSGDKAITYALQSDNSEKTEKTEKTEFKQRKVEIASHVSPTVKGVGPKAKKDTPVSTPINSRKVAVNKKEENTDSGMITDLNKIVEHPGQGIPKDMLVKLMKLADIRKSAVAVRHVERIARQLLEDGFPTKSFHIKGKSANWGLQAGTIPIDQNLSKKAGSPEVDKLSKSVAECLKKQQKNSFFKKNNDTKVSGGNIADNGSGFARKTHLSISDKRIKELESLGFFEDVIKGVDKNGKEQWTVSVRERNDVDGKLSKQVARKNDNGTWDTYRLTESGEEKPIEVLAHVPTEEGEKPMPLTADIDLLFEAIPMKELDLGGYDRVPNPMVSPSLINKNTKNYKNQHTKDLLLKDFLSNEKPDTGNASKRVEDLIRQGNEVINRKYPVIHHGTDAFNPFSKESENYPITVFIPENAELGFTVAMVFDESQMEDIISKLHSKEFFVPQNPLWNKNHRRPSFDNAKKYWEGK